MFESFNALVNEPMSAHTTLKLGGPADYMVFPRDGEEIAAMFREAAENSVPVTVIGHGSNLLVLDGGIRGLVICIGKNMRKITREGNILKAQAGAMLGSVALEAAEAGLTGLEFASGIPGTVGGGVTMNAGAYDGEMAQVVTEVRGIRPDGTAVCLSREEMDFSYRHSVVQEKDFIVTEVTFELQPGDPAAIRARMSELNAKRSEKQPLDLPSAGSTFKRPEGYYAAALIDQCGLKGYSIGGARVSEKHAGFLVNTGTSSRDFLNLMKKVQAIVEERAGVRLEPEIRIVGTEE
ncbi:UDP-N-acetylmuramate dehydrogenase [Aristaeella lactis]|uniref:UDP-N-acetylmuramate dehydrogenase n=1 Tax=Aristaeella lactis TaxID=3046383 RepID=A0AC61PNU4_9FIRM|nr:UDP-N-acetylmuramate dehydrogenase [Aristaeella lactis]QUA53359.1 UDP-N-acetylmuramate dehydrogenase [Aristaeella lactis]SMC79595.1 UDP-N-acetylmuramate dehydrogenase [Aristaeella lactis]